MTQFTQKQLDFIANKAAGMKNRPAAVAAGYAENSADVMAARLIARPDIKAAIAKAKRGMKRADTKPDVDDDVEVNPKQKMPKASYTDAKEFLTDAMNHKHLPIAARADYAKALLPYQHARIGEAGKKEKAKERAHAVAGGGEAKRNRLTPKGAPKLYAVGSK